MQRTQIYFPEELHQDLKIGAAMMKVSLSEYVRSILKKRLYITRPSSKKGLPSKSKARPSVIAENAVSLGIKDLARNFDKYFEESLK